MTFPTVVAEFAFGGLPGTNYLMFDDTTRGKFDTGVIAPDSTFATITGDSVRAFSTSRGRQRALEDYRPGTATVALDNRSGNYDPNNLSGPYVSAGVTQVRPMIRGRIRATVLGTTYDVYYGFTDSWTVTYRLPSDVVSTAAMTDAFKVLGGFIPPAAGVAVGTGEDTGARIGRVLDSAGWSATDRDLDVGTQTLQGTKLGIGALDEIQGAVASELGHVYVSPDGKVTFRNRTSRLTRSASVTSQCTFGDGGGAELPYSDIVLAYDDTLVRNAVSGTNTGGTTQTSSDSASIARYLTKSYNGTNMWLQLDANALLWCQWQVYQWTEADLRIDSITLLPQGNDSLWPYALGLKIGDRVTVKRRPPAGDTISRDVFVEGIDHQVTANPKKWVTKLYFSDASKFSGFLIFDDATKGKFNTGKIAA